MGTYDTLNDVLVNLFRDINSIEENAITSQEYKDLTNNDMHVINAIGVGTTKNMSSIAKELSVTVGDIDPPVPSWLSALLFPFFADKGNSENKRDSRHLMGEYLFLAAHFH